MFAIKKQIEKINEKVSLSLFATAIGFIFILVFSWTVFKGNLSPEEEQTHSFLQEEFQNLVSNYIEKKYPKVEEIVFHKVWTKSTSQANQIKIFFHYSLKTSGPEGGDLFIKGHSFLERSENQTNLWIAKDFTVTDSFVEFSEPMLIKAGDIQNEK